MNDPLMVPAPEPGARLPGESAKAFHAFTIYRDLGANRTYGEVGRRIYGTPAGRKRGATGRIRAWAKRWRWHERAAAWDELLDQQQREASISEVRQMVERHTKLAPWMKGKLFERLRDLDPRELSPAELASWLKVAVAVEREARGLDTPTGSAVTVVNQLSAHAEASAISTFTPAEERAAWGAIYQERYGVQRPWFNDDADTDAADEHARTP